MKHFLPRLVLALVALPGLTAQGQYVAIDLNSSTYAPTTGQGVSGAYQVGEGTVSGRTQALLWNNSSTNVTNLTPSGFTSAQALGMTANQEVGEGVTTAGNTVALLWSGGNNNATNLNPTINGVALTSSVANGISGNQQVGSGRLSTGSSFALLWNGTAASAVNLNPNGYTSSVAYGTSGLLQVGFASTSTYYDHAMVWSGSSFSAVDLNPSGYSQSFATAVSGNTVVGYVQTNTGINQAFLWYGPHNTIDLNPSGFSNSYALGVSGSTEVGYGFTNSGQQQALLWNGTAASVVNLSAYLPNGATNAVAQGIDSSGNVVGYATVNGQTHAFLWQPHVPPSFTNTALAVTVATGLNYNFTFTAGGHPAPSFSLTSGSLPPGFTLYSNGALTGIPTQPGTYAGTITASNGVSPNATQSFTIVVVTDPIGALSTVGLFASGYGYETGSLIQGLDQNFYGVAYDGGSALAGTIFEFTPGGTESLIHTFADGSVVNDGKEPSSLLQTPDGTFYGTTAYGGSGSTSAGTIFKLDQGVITILHNFQDGSVAQDGSGPGDLFQGKNGNFYGITLNGGSTANAGTIFTATPQGCVTILHLFHDGSVTNDGALPQALIQGSDGNFYGTTHWGGSSADSGVGYGSFFSMTPAKVVTILHGFGDGSVTNDGQYPGPLVEGSDGNFYGTTSNGGSNQTGTVYKMTPQGVVTILHSFGDGTVYNDGVGPEGLIEGPDGNFYGLTEYGGSASNGTLYQITPQGVMVVLHSFGDGSITNEGINPVGSLLQAADGSYYGLAYAGGPNDEGTLFKFSFNSAPVFSTSTPPGTGNTSTAYSFTFTASGSPAPTFALTSGTLPPGLTLSPTGVLSGIPTQTGTFSGTVTASNNFGSPATENFTITIIYGATDTPTMPPWGLAVLAVLLIAAAARALPKPVS